MRQQPLDRAAAATKRLVEAVLAGASGAGWRRRATRGGRLVLAYHNIVPPGERAVGDRSLHLAAHSFVAQLDRLGDSARVVSLESLVAGPHDDGDARPRVAITFDDAYAGAIAVGVPEVARRGWPAVVFVAPAMLGRTSCWWDALAIGSGDELPDALRTHALARLAGREDAIRAWAQAEGLGVGEPPEHERIASEPEVLGALVHPEVTLGGHSWSHANLVRLDAEALREELVRSKAWLERAGAQGSALMAYPYGEWTPAVGQAALEAGFAGGFRVNGGWWTRDSAATPMALPRYNVAAGLSVDGFRLRLAGWFSA